MARTETRTECSACGIETTVPFKPTQGRPVLCRQCFQLKGRAPLLQPAAQTPPSAFVDSQQFALSMALSQDVSALTALSVTSEGASLSADAAILAATSMTSAPPHSSVATSADLASITESEEADGVDIPGQPEFLNPTRSLILSTPMEMMKVEKKDSDTSPAQPDKLRA